MEGWMVYKVVSVEDEPEIAELLRIVLGNPEVEVHTADNGRDGLSLVRSIKPDLVVLDVMMPGGMNGWDIYDAIRTAPDTSRVPVIMLSVLREKAERRRAFAGSEIDLYMTKPFDTLRLRKEVERMLGRGGLWQTPQQAASLAPQPAVAVANTPVVSQQASASVPPVLTSPVVATVTPADIPVDTAAGENPAAAQAVDGSDKKDG